jgi:hypothetical protein
MFSYAYILIIFLVMPFVMNQNMPDQDAKTMLYEVNQSRLEVKSLYTTKIKPSTEKTEKVTKTD